MPVGANPDELLARLDQLLGLSAAAVPARPEILPLAEPVAPPEIKANDSPPALAARVLLVDDNQDYRRVVKFLLEAAGCEVFEAPDGVEALKIATHQKLDLLLLDFDMPGLNGYEVLQELRRRDDTRKLPVILITGAAKRRQLKELGMDLAAFLDKPVANEVLMETVARVLHRPPPTNVPKNIPPPPPTAPEILLPEEDDMTEGGDDLLLEEQRKEAEEEQSGLEILSADSPIANRVNKILVRAVAMRASDIHVEPQEKHVVVRVRVDGALQVLYRLPSIIAPQLAARIKIMSNLVITERRRPQDGQIRATIGGKKVEFRVSTLPSLHGEKVVMRVLGGASLRPGVGELMLRPRDEEVVRRGIDAPHGLLLVTGPTGSGKTTTLYTMLYDLNKPEYNVMTAEDPVEYELAGVTQVPVKAHIGLTFEAILRSFLRQDPDIMLVGEIRDLETAEIAVKAAITGHLVLSTLHTNSAPGAIQRLAHMGVATYLIADSVKLVMAQRLLRKVCPQCKEPSPPSADILRLAGEGAAERLKGAVKGRGCAACGKSGYKGRLPIFEVMEIHSPEIRQMILTNASIDALTKQAVAEGTQTLKEAALDAVTAGKTSVDEALSIILAD